MVRHQAYEGVENSMNRQVPLWLWAVVAYLGVLIIGTADWLTGYELNFFVFYFIPVSVGAWYLGLASSASLAVLSALVWFSVDFLSGHQSASHFHAVWNTTTRLVSFLAIGWSVFRIRELLVRERKSTEMLRQALSEIKVLEAFLPICAQCKKIRNQQGEWQNIETYIMQHSDTRFSHGYCPSCARKALKDAGLDNEKD